MAVLRDVAAGVEQLAVLRVYVLGLAGQHDHLVERVVAVAAADGGGGKGVEVGAPVAVAVAVAVGGAPQEGLLQINKGKENEGNATE